MGLVPTADQCKKLETIRETAIKYGVNMFINARTDAYLLKISSNYMDDTIERGNAYRDAGADGFYPVLIDNYEDIERVVAETSLPLNVLLMKQVGDLNKLEQIGVKRVSLGPGSLKYVLTKFRDMAAGLMRYDTAEFFREELMSNDAVMSLVKKTS